MRKALAGTLLVTGVATAAAATTFLWYQHDIRRARERATSGSRALNTACGTIEYGEVGCGVPFLSIHGTGGGFDQGLLLARQLGIDQSRYRVIAPSRYGYLGTPMPAGESTPAAEGRAHAALLDSLGISEPVVVAGGSAGALSALQFAIQYPERVRTLILLVPDAWAPEEEKRTGLQDIGGSNVIRENVLKSDFILWAALTFGRASMAEYVGVSRELQRNMSVGDRLKMNETLESILPVSRRWRGIAKEEANHAAMERYELEKITAPTLVIDATDIITYPGSKYTSEHIAHARFVEFESGGHLLIGHGDEVQAAVSGFLVEVVSD